MEIRRLGFLGLTMLLLGGCASSRRAQMNSLDRQVAHLDGRVSMIEQQMGLIEGKAWNQREDVSYLKGRVEGMQGGFGQSGRTTAITYTPKRIQTALKNAGHYTGGIDGKIGPQTKQAIKEFQRTHGLSVDGKVGSKTWAQLARYLPTE